MQYAIPEELTIGTYSVGWNTELSPTDVSFMRAQYPSADSEEVAIEVGAPPTIAALGGRSEIDTFRFEVASAGTHIVTSTGTSDTVLTVHGPGDPGAVVAWDDDRGAGRNGRIVRRLEPGAYWLTVAPPTDAGSPRS